MATKEFSNNYKILVAPVLLFIAGSIVYFNVPDFTWGYILLFGSGILFIVGFIAGYRTYVISDDNIHIEGLTKKMDINIQDIASQHRNTSFYKGVESITWKLKLKNGEIITIISDQVKDPSRFKEVLNWLLRGIPQEDK